MHQIQMKRVSEGSKSLQVVAVVAAAVVVVVGRDQEPLPLGLVVGIQLYKLLVIGALTAQ